MATNGIEYKILKGSALEILKTLPAESVQCVITSPPYYGLRSYNTPPQIWGNHNGCEHRWGENLPFIKQDNRSLEEKIQQGANVGSNQKFNAANTTATSGAFCLNCNAWRGELGLEPTFQMYIDHLVEIFAEVKRVLKRDGTCFVNLGDSYAGSGKGIGSDHGKAVFTDAEIVKTDWRNIGLPAKSLMNIPARFAIRMTDELQFIQRNEIIWHKPAAMPSSAKDRFTVDFEPIYFFAKSGKYKFNQQFEQALHAGVGNSWQERKAAGEPVRQGLAGAKAVGAGFFSTAETRNKRTTWRVSFEPSGDEHYAAYPTKLLEPMVLAGTDDGDVILDPFNGTGTTGFVALQNRRGYIGIELQEKYIAISERRLENIPIKLNF